MKNLLKAKKQVVKGEIPSVRDLRDYIKHRHKLPPDATEEEMAQYIAIMDMPDEEETKMNAPSRPMGPQGKKGFYESQSFDSQWEFFYYVWKKEIRHEYIERNKSEFVTYFDEAGKNHRFYPDFRVAGGYAEVKGIYRESDLQKKEQHPEIEFIDKVQMKDIVPEVKRLHPNWKNEYTLKY